MTVITGALPANLIELMMRGVPIWCQTEPDVSVRIIELRKGFVVCAS